MIRPRAAPRGRASSCVDRTGRARRFTCSAVYRVAGLDQIDALFRGEANGYFYARDGHPNAAALAEKLAGLEGAEAGLVCGSGMAAESALLLTMLGQGDEVALADGMYGKTAVLVGRELARFGVGVRVFDAARPDSLVSALTPRTRLVFAETISNPLLRVADIPGLAAVLQALGHDAKLAIDNTFAPLICRPLDLGAEVVTHSVTKLIGGHSDVTLGFLAGRRPFIEACAGVASAFGLTGNPFDSWLALRGVSTLHLRSERACQNALALAERLADHSRVQAVHYPGLPRHPDHTRAKSLLSQGFGTIVTIDLGDRARADAFIGGLRHVPFAPSLGDVATTLSHPSTTSHRALTVEEASRQGITPGFVRLSIGLETVSDLWDDFRQALEGLG